MPYYDRFITPDVAKQISSWGALTEYSSYNVYQWIKSKYSPSEHLKKFAAGEVETAPAMKQLYTTNRVWEYIPIAWKYSKNPKAKARGFFDCIDTIQIKEPNSITGSLIAIDKHSFEYNDISDVANIIIHSGDSVVNANGEYKITDTQKYYVVGSKTDYFNINIEDRLCFSSVTVEVNDADTSSIRNNLGDFKFSIETVSGFTYAKAMCIRTGDVQKLILNDTENLVGARETYYFDRFGFKVKFICKYDHSHSLFGTEETRIAQLVDLFENLTFSIRESVFADTILPAKTNEIIGASNNFKYVAFYAPTKEELEADGLSPANKYEPTYCNTVNLDSSIIDLHIDAINERNRSTK
jgi:hypothetical protein